MKAIFKSSAFKCIVVLLSIILVCGGLLAILSDVFNVSDEERKNRAVAKIYGKEVEFTSTSLEIDESFHSDNGDIKTVYAFSNGDHLVKVTGKKGFSNGSITLWVAIKDDLSIRNVVLDSNRSQTLMSKLTGIYVQYKDQQTLNKIMDAYYNGSAYTTDTIVTGATYSSNACNNAVAVAVDYVKTISGGNS